MLITLGLVAFGGAIAQFIYSFLSSLRRANGVKPFPGPKGKHLVGMFVTKAHSCRLAHSGQHFRHA